MDVILFDTPLGRMGLGSEWGDAITRLFFPDDLPSLIVEHMTPLLSAGKRQLLEYFAGERTAFDLPLAAAGTSFQKSVWAALSGIPYGETRTYRDIAVSVGNPGAARAVGNACRRNPIPVLIPCHRVVGWDGSLTGFGGGLALKKKLLAVEEEKRTVL